MCLDATDHLVIEDFAEFQALSLTQGHSQHPDPLVLNMWMVQSVACLCRGLEPGFTEVDTVYCGTGTSYQETHLLRY